MDLTGTARGGGRDRHGRGLRGPGLLPGSPARSRARTPRDRFDSLVLDVVAELEARWSDHLGLVEYAVEDIPQIPDTWAPDRVPLSSLVRGSGATPSRLVVFRRPIEHRCDTREELEALVLTVVVEQVADLLNVAPEVVDPRIGGEE